MSNLTNVDCFTGIVVEIKVLDDKPEEEVEDGPYKFTLDNGTYFILRTTVADVSRIETDDQVIAAKSNFDPGQYALFVIRGDDRVGNFIVHQRDVVRNEMELIYK